MRITRRERDYIRPAINHGWQIVIYYRTQPRWDGDNLMPVKVGPLCERLIKKGILERVVCSGLPEKIQLTKAGKQLKCIVECCHWGKLQDEWGEVVGECAVCEGTGVRLEVEI